MLFENNNVSLIHTQAPLPSKQSTFLFLNLHIRYGTGYDWYNRAGNGIRDPNGTDSVYVSV